MEKVKWYSAEDKNFGYRGSPRFVDSKFALAKSTSVVRELIQNSLDVKDKEKENEPVKVDINITGLKREAIPGIDELIRRIKLCLKYANVDAEYSYKTALELLSKPTVYCLKISDRNTIGLSMEKDEKGKSHFNALVYNEGDSYGKEDGSAGSHGVGKNASYIASECNTVFYATKYKDKSGKDVSITIGKHILSTWEDDGNKMCGEGWYGIPEEDTVKPIHNGEKYNIDNYFLRIDEYGTDVISVAIDYANKEAEYKKKYINEVLENFYVAIIEGKLSVNVFDVLINDKTFDDVLNEYYFSDKKPSLAGTNKCLLIGNLYETKRTYLGVEPEKIDIEVDGEKIGDIEIFFSDENKFKKKYYSIIRSHGMKIRDYWLNTEKEFTAIVKINGKELNKRLLRIENAAHDDFLMPDPESGIRPPQNCLDALKQIKTIVEKYIKERTKIESEALQKVEGLGTLLSLPGKISTAKIVDNEVKIVKPKKPRAPKPHVEPDKKIFKEYTKWPRIIECPEGLKSSFECDRKIDSGCIILSPVDSEEREIKGINAYYGDVIALLDGKEMEIVDDLICFEMIEKGSHIIEFQTKEILPYKYAVDIYENCQIGGENNE